MRLKLRTPSPKRATRWGRALGAAGTFLGTVAGTLPIGVSAKRRTGPNPVKLALPITGGAVVVGVFLRRRRSGDSDQGYSPSPLAAEPNAATGVDGFGPPATGLDATTSMDATVAPTSTAPRVDPLVPTDAVDTATEQARVEAVDGPSVEGVVEAPRDAAGETPASSEAGEQPGS